MVSNTIFVQYLPQYICTCKVVVIKSSMNRYTDIKVEQKLCIFDSAVFHIERLSGVFIYLHVSPLNFAPCDCSV